MMSFILNIVLSLGLVAAVVAVLLQVRYQRELRNTLHGVRLTLEERTLENGRLRVQLKRK